MRHLAQCHSLDCVRKGLLDGGLVVVLGEVGNNMLAEAVVPMSTWPQAISHSNMDILDALYCHIPHEEARKYLLEDVFGVQLRNNLIVSKLLQVGETVLSPVKLENVKKMLCSRTYQLRQSIGRLRGARGSQVIGSREHDDLSLRWSTRREG